jgi:ribosomal protein S12 methylthiotransferase accessory factor
MPIPFARAASALLGDESGASADPDVGHLLQALDYGAVTPAAPGDKLDPKTVNRAHLLEAASRFVRVFELAAPDAPGLVSFGAEFDPALADPLHVGSPLVGVSGVGLSLQEAFQGCIGEGVEYLSQLQTGSDVLLTAGFDDGKTMLGPRALEFVAALSERRSRPHTGLSWHRATRLIDGCEVLLPAGICLRRPPGQREFAPPFPLSIGSAAGPSLEAAALHGLLELIERDAASLWWWGGQRGRSIPAQDEASATAKNLLQQLRHANPASRRTSLLDITTDVGVPCVAAVSWRPDGFGFAFGLAARLTLAAAARSAILEMCQIELADAVVATKRSERGDAALNATDRVHLRRAAMINADQCALLQPVSERATHLAIVTTDPSAALRLIVRRLEKLGIETFCLDLTRPRFAVPVARVIAPGLQLEPSEIVTARLADTIARTGGGTTYTGGVALI